MPISIYSCQTRTQYNFANIETIVSRPGTSSSPNETFHLYSYYIDSFTILWPLQPIWNIMTILSLLQSVATGLRTNNLLPLPLIEVLYAAYRYSINIDVIDVNGRLTTWTIPDSFRSLRLTNFCHYLVHVQRLKFEWCNLKKWNEMSGTLK